jgi:hypothetical protein
MFDAALDERVIAGGRIDRQNGELLNRKAGEFAASRTAHLRGPRVTMVQSAESGERAAGSNSAPAHSGAVLEAVRACLQISQHVFGCRCMWRYRLAVPHLDSHLLLCNRLHGGDINHANAYCRLMCSSRCIVLRLPTCNLITSSAIVTLIIRHTVSRTAEFSMRENRSWRKHVYTH